MGLPKSCRSFGPYLSLTKLSVISLACREYGLFMSFCGFIKARTPMCVRPTLGQSFNENLSYRYGAKKCQKGNGSAHRHGKGEYCIYPRQNSIHSEKMTHK